MNLQKASGNKNWDDIDKQWVEGVGGAQRLFPVHVVNEYCAPWTIQPIPNFNVNYGSSRKFYNYARLIKMKIGLWLVLSWVSVSVYIKAWVAWSRGRFALELGLEAYPARFRRHDGVMESKNN